MALERKPHLRAEKIAGFRPLGGEGMDHRPNHAIHRRGRADGLVYRLHRCQIGLVKGEYLGRDACLDSVGRGDRFLPDGRGDGCRLDG